LRSGRESTTGTAGTSTLDIQSTALDGVLIVTPKRFGDDRGFFSEVWNRHTLAAHGLEFDFVQDNHSLSRAVGVVRGLHYQSPPHAQDKLVRVGSGAVLDVAVDVRAGSPTYGKWLGVELSAENGRQLLIPKGFLHGFMTLTPQCDLLYKCSDVYAPDCDGAVYFADDDLGIDWGMCGGGMGADTDADAMVAAGTLSPKDRRAQRFADFRSPFVYEG
jgi:dTDP-4-dehydrorhamnose 3,5-epimerase